MKGVKLLTPVDPGSPVQGRWSGTWPDGMRTRNNVDTWNTAEMQGCRGREGGRRKKEEGREGEREGAREGSERERKNKGRGKISTCASEGLTHFLPTSQL